MEEKTIRQIDFQTVGLADRRRLERNHATRGVLADSTFCCLFSLCSRANWDFSRGRIASPSDVAKCAFYSEAGRPIAALSDFGRRGQLAIACGIGLTGVSGVPMGGGEPIDTHSLNCA